MKKILIVDDSPFFRGLLKSGLKKEAHMLQGVDVEVVEADDQKSSMKQIQDEKPDLVILDIVMRESEHEGVNILQNIRKKYPSQKVIMLTSVGQTSVINKCREYGILDYIEKPIDDLQLAKILKKYL